MGLERFTFNTAGATARKDKMAGKDYLVVPVVMLTEGVHGGSQGPLFYPKEELSKFPAVWNNKPLVVYHPVDGTACDPVTLTKQSVGVLMNTQFDGRLKSEAWIDEARADEVDDRILKSVLKGQPMEVSTGLWTENEQTAGEWNGEKYTAIARNFRPDHLAILPDKIGACSLADGAGLLVNESGIKLLVNSPETLKEGLFTALLKKGAWSKIHNEMSHSSVSSALYAVLRETIGDWDGWIEDVFDSYFIYWNSGDLLKQAYVATDTEVSLVGEPKMVKRVVEYQTVANAATESTMSKKELVDGLIANEATHWKEDDRKFLDTLTEDALKKMAPIPAKAPVSNADPDDDDDDDEEDTTPVANTKGKKKPVVATPVENTQFDYNAWLKSAPANVQQVMNEAVSTHNAEVNRLADIIVANAANVFSKEDLVKKPISELRAIAALAKGPEQQQFVPAPLFYGANTPAPIVNQVTEEPLVMPTLNFGKKDAA